MVMGDDCTVSHLTALTYHHLIQVQNVMILIENANQSSKQKDKSKIKAATSFYRVYFDVDQKKC